MHLNIARFFIYLFIWKRNLLLLLSAKIQDFNKKAKTSKVYFLLSWRAEKWELSL